MELSYEKIFFNLEDAFKFLNKIETKFKGRFRYLLTTEEETDKNYRYFNVMVIYMVELE